MPETYIYNKQMFKELHYTCIIMYVFE